MIVLLDQDGVLADFERGFLLAWAQAYPDQPAIPLAQRRRFRLAEDYPEHLRADVAAVYAAPGFFLDLPPIEGAISAVGEMLAAGLDVRICTAAIDDYENCVLEKFRWVERHLGRDFTHRMILTKDKTLVAGDWLVDDKPAITGSRAPQWQHVLFDAPYNRQVSDVPRLNWTNWRSVLLPN